MRWHQWEIINLKLRLQKTSPALKLQPGLKADTNDLLIHANWSLQRGLL